MQVSSEKIKDKNFKKQLFKIFTVITLIDLCYFFSKLCLAYHIFFGEEYGTINEQVSCPKFENQN